MALSEYHEFHMPMSSMALSGDHEFHGGLEFLGPEREYLVFHMPMSSMALSGFTFKVT
jgi:hypothetical protein